MSLFTGGGDPDVLANKGQYIEFFHLVSGTVVYFRAFLTQFEDQYESEWNEDQVFGRMDPISTFKRTGRKINLGWRVVADSVDSSKANLAKVGTLLQMLYPSYSGGGSSTHISGPPLMKLKFMNMITNSVTEGEEGGGSANTRGLLGYVNGFTNAPVLDDGFIEDAGGAEIFPKTIEMSCTFTVLHTHTPGWEAGTFLGGAGFPYGTTLSSVINSELAAQRATDAEHSQAQSVYDTYINQFADNPEVEAIMEGTYADLGLLESNPETLGAQEGVYASVLPPEPDETANMSGLGEGDGGNPEETTAQADEVLGGGGGGLAQDAP